MSSIAYLVSTPWSMSCAPISFKMASVVARDEIASTLRANKKEAGLLLGGRHVV